MGVWGWGLFTCPYPLKVQACPPRDQRPALQSRDSGLEEARSSFSLINDYKQVYVIFSTGVLLMTLVRFSRGSAF